MSIIILILLATTTTFYGDRFNKHTKLDAIKYSLSTPNNSIKIEDESTSKSIEYIPQVGTHAGVALTKYEYTLALSFLDPLNKKQIEDGEKRSKYFDVNFNKTFEKYSWDLYYQHYSGFKLKNEDIATTQLLSIETINYGIHVNYYLSDEFDAKKSTGHSSLNKKTSWSTLIGLGLSQNFLQSNQTLIPTELETSFSEYKGLKGIRKNSLSLEYGVAGQYVHNKFYLQGQIAVGANIGKIHYDGSNLKDTTKSGPSSLINFNFGYEFKNSLLGLALSSYSVSDEQNDQFISTSKSEALFYYNFIF